ncbi:MAG TPA: cytochrome c [Candidatus Udaeobacter sp.]|nr:cytochrome c [Candidatus Udaeobacter sp.]
MKCTLLVIAAAAGVVAVIMGAQEKWVAPARASAKKNPVKADAASSGRGKAVYTAECASCHGSGGKGDGPAAKDLEVPAGDLTKLGGQTDGALFWKVTEGKKPMASYATKLSEQQRWDVVNYMRTLK